MKNIKIKNKLAYFALIIVVIALDQGTKQYLINFFQDLPSHTEQFFSNEVDVLPFLKIVYAWNKGISFGMFSSFKYSNIVFLVLSSSIITILLLVLLKTRNATECIAYSLIIGGAIGNIIDRLTYEAVFDFIYFYANNYYWPAFNIADASVFIGVALFIMNLIYHRKDKVR